MYYTVYMCPLQLLLDLGLPLPSLLDQWFNVLFPLEEEGKVGFILGLGGHWQNLIRPPGGEEEHREGVDTGPQRGVI